MGRFHYSCKNFHYRTLVWILGGRGRGGGVGRFHYSCKNFHYRTLVWILGFNRNEFFLVKFRRYYFDKETLVIRIVPRTRYCVALWVVCLDVILGYFSLRSCFRILLERYERDFTTVGHIASGDGYIHCSVCSYLPIQHSPVLGRNAPDPF